MGTLQAVTILLAAIIAVVHAPLLLNPGLARDWIGKLPRNKVAAWVLTGIDALWIWWLLTQTPLGRFENIRMLFYAAVPVVGYLVIRCMDELLAARALGGLLLLAPAPILAVAEHGIPLRLVVVLLAYVLVLFGLILVLTPYQFRRLTTRMMANDKQTKAWGALGICLAGLLLILALTAYA